jgi:subtilisin family serine protease
MSGRPPLAKTVLSLGALILLLTVPAQAIEIDSELAAKVAAPSRADGPVLVDILVVLDAPLAAEQIRGQLERLPREERRRQLIGILQEQAGATQSALLADLRTAGSGVEDVQSLWISNAIRLKGDQRALDILSTSPVEGWATENRATAVVEAAQKSEETIAPGDGPAEPLASVIPTVWSLDWINVPQAWATGYDGTGVLIAHLDSGVWFDHADLADRVWYNTAEIPDNGIDDDGNGYVDDFRGWDFGDRDNDPTDDAWDFVGGGHGTHTAGTVCGDGTNGLRTGVAPGAKIMVCKPTRTEDGYAITSAVWEAQQYALTMGADLMTMSLGAVGPLPLALLQGERYVGDALRFARVALFTSAGNAHGGIDPRYELTGVGRVPGPWHEDEDVPYSSLSGVITVGATAFQEDTNWEYSSQGPADWSAVRPWSDWDSASGNGLIKPDISAPGMGVSSLLRPNNYSQTNWNGTSMACPHAAGVAALMLNKNPTLTPADLARILMTTAVDLGSPGKDNVFGAGRIDAAAALDAVPLVQVASVVISEATLDDANGNGYLEPGEDFELLLGLFNNNLVDATALRIEAAVTGGTEYVTLTDGSVTAAGIPAGQAGVPNQNPSFTVTSVARQGDPFEITVTLRTSAGYFDQFDLPFKVGRPEIADHSAGALHLTVTDHGTLGWSDLDQLEGWGCGIKEVSNLLYIGGFWAGSGPSYVADNDYTLVAPGDWQASVSPVGAIDEPVAKRSDRDLVAVFNDGNHTNPRGVQVTQRSMVWEGADAEDFVVLEYDIINTSMTALNDYYAAVFCDWDIYYYDYNVGGTDLSRNLVWMSEMYVTQEHVGMMLLGGDAASNVSVIDNTQYVHPYLNLRDQDKYRFMTGELALHRADRDGEYSTVVAAGPYDIPSGGRVKVAFAIVHGRNLEDLESNADMANQVYAATPVGSDPVPISRRLDLSQNRPNPFNPNTAIEFEIPRDGEVHLAVYDVAGRMVRALAHRRYAAGRHSVIWDGRDDSGRVVASGTYFYRMTSSRETLTRKMTLLK